MTELHAVPEAESGRDQRTVQQVLRDAREADRRWGQALDLAAARRDQTAPGLTIRCRDGCPLRARRCYRKSRVENSQTVWVELWRCKLGHELVRYLDNSEFLLRWEFK